MEETRMVLRTEDLVKKLNKLFEKGQKAVDEALDDEVVVDYVKDLERKVRTELETRQTW